MIARRDLPALAGLLLLCAAGTAQSQAVAAVPDRSTAFRAAEAAEHAQLRAANGELGLPPLPAVTSTSPRSALLFEDRRFVNQAPGAQADSGPTLVQVVLPPSQTGTSFSEILWYQLPSSYVPGQPRPMVIAWHGFGGSANSVALQSTLDEEAYARGWIYLAVTGLDDKLFGTPICQQHGEAAIQYMTSHFSVDADRLYMVGFSMGGGVVSSFAARHRDPAGIMIAALGIVSGAFDHAETYNLGNAATKSIMENPYNFGGSAAAQPFRYQQASALFHLTASYPPAPGSVDPVLSMGDNLDTLPVWMTWDTGDPLVENLPVQATQLAALIAGEGGSVQTHPVSGTVDPVTLLPAPHSWAVLDEVALFDFFEGQVVNRTPASFHAQLDRDTSVSCAGVTQRVPGAFSFVNGSAAAGTLGLADIVNAEVLVADAGVAGLGAPPPRVTATSGDGDGLQLRLTGFDTPPSYLLRVSDGTLVTGVDSDPATDSLIAELPGLSTLDVQVVSVPWTAKLWSSPDPAPLGGAVALNLDAVATSVTAFLIVSTGEQLTPIKGGSVITASLFAPSLLLQVPLDANGDFALAGTMPGNAALSGLRLPTQAVTLGPGNSVTAVSNLWGLHLE